MRGADAADGQQVVGAHQGRGAVGAVQGFAQHLWRSGHEGHLQHRLGPQACLLHAARVAPAALLRAVRGAEQPADHGDAAVPQRGQMGHHVGHSQLAVHRHAGVIGVVVVGQHIGQPHLGQPLQCGGGGGVRNHQDHPVYVARQQQVHGAVFLVQAVVGGERRDGVATRYGGLGNAFQAFGKHGVGERGQHHAQHAAALGAQGARAGVGQIAQGAGDVLHMLARGRGHFVRHVENTRHGGNRHTGLAGDFQNAHGSLVQYI